MTLDPIAARLAAAGCVAPELEAQLLLEEAGDPAELDALVGRRVAGEPLEHVVGWAAFGGRRVAVGPGVFVPRPRTEALAARAVAVLRAARPPRIAVDLCTGSGALAVILATGVPDARVLAVDDDATALRYARQNGVAVGVEVLAGDLDATLPSDVRGRVAVLTAVVPYVPSAEILYQPREARDHEPRRALDGGPDGLDVLWRVVAAAPSVLAPRGRVLLELAESQVPAAAEALRTAGFDAVVEGRDEDDEVTFVEASAPPLARRFERRSGALGQVRSSTTIGI